MRKSVHVLSSGSGQPLLNWVFSLQGFSRLSSLPLRSSPNHIPKISPDPNPKLAQKNLLIWFIDDDPINNLLNRSLMEDHFPSFQLTIFQDPQVALNELGNPAKKHPDFIFLDLNMPGFNGWDFMDAFTEKNYNSNVYVLTSSIDPEDRNLAELSKIICGFYSKPLLPEMIQEAIQKGK